MGYDNLGYDLGYEGDMRGYDVGICWDMTGDMIEDMIWGYDYVIFIILLRDMMGYVGIWFGIWRDMSGYDILIIALLLRDMTGYDIDKKGYEGIWSIRDMIK